MIRGSHGDHDGTNNLSEFFRKAKQVSFWICMSIVFKLENQWSDVADFEQRELLKLRIFTSLKQTSTLLTMITIVNI